MGHKNTGILNEQLIVDALNNHKVKDLNHNLRFMLQEIYGVLNDEEIVESGLLEGYMKPDIFIKYKNETHYISIKEGRATTVHQDKIENFINTLRSINVSEKTIETILLFH